ncbi:MAG: ABC transporter substrate-binding protein, partial [Desertimonas sp.]
MTYGIAAPSDAEYDTEGTITYAAAADIATFDPHKSAAGGTIVEYGTLIYAGLTDIDPGGNPIPDLATDWEFIEEDGSPILRMNLREGVAFHDGEPLDAEAVKANLERGKTVEGSTVAPILSSIEEIEVTGIYSVDLVLSTMDVSLPGAFAHQAGRMLSPASFDDPSMDQHPVSAGPYRVTDYLPGDRIELERFDAYWNTDAVAGGPRYFVYRIMPDATARYSALQTGQIDAASVTGLQMAEAESAGLDTYSFPGLGYYTIWFNSSREQFQDVRVRQAINIAIDREAINQSILQGYGTPTIQPFPEGYIAYNPEFPVDYYAYDPARARDLLAEAGFADGVEFEFMSFPLSPHEDIA